MTRIPIAPTLLLLAGLAQAEEAAQTPRTTTQAERVEVVGDQATVSGYQAQSAVSANKNDTPLLDTPQAITVVPQALIADQGARRLEEVLRNVAGITPGGYYADWDYYRIRGFDAAFTTNVDGFRALDGKNVELFNVQQVDVLKGPTSALYGNGPLGGMVNIVSKRPTGRTFVDAELTGGSYGYIEPALDAGVAITDDGTLSARLVTLIRDRDSFVDQVHKRRYFVAPSVKWDIGDHTDLTVLTSYRRDDDQLGDPLPASGTIIANPNGNIPFSRYIGEPDSNLVDERLATAGYEFNHRFNDALAFRQNVRLQQHRGLWDHVMYAGFLAADQRTLYRYPYSYDATSDQVSVDNGLETSFTTGSVSHRLMVGFEFERQRSRSTSWQIDYSDPAAYTPIDLFDPVYGSPIPDEPNESRSSSRGLTRGYYIQEQATIAERLILMGGARVDSVAQDGEKSHGTSPRVGATFLVTPNVSLYSCLSRSFNPQWYSRDKNGDIVEPETGTDIEAGVKTALPDDLLSALVSVYQLTRRNVATADPSTPDPYDAVVSGEQRSRGIELELGSHPLAGLELTANYTLTNASVAEDNSLPVGDRLPGVARHSANTWARYTLQAGDLRGLGAGLGAHAYSNQEATLPNSFDLPGYVLFDAALYYDRGWFHSQLNLKNALDKQYYSGAYNDLSVLPGDPLTVQATIGCTF